MLLEVAFFAILFLILFPFIIYPFTIVLLSLLHGKKEMKKYSQNELPNVSLIISAYNEEMVIHRKLKETLGYNYPKEKLEVIVVSDDSNDQTNQIVNEFIASSNVNHPKFEFINVSGRVGKTICQNIASKVANGEILAFSDTNSMWDRDALLKLIEVFSDDQVGYVSGNLVYINSDADLTSNAEKIYWGFDKKIREYESNLSSIVGGNGAIYAIRKANYVELPALLSHDGFMPTKIVLQGKKAKFVKEAVAQEYTNTDSKDEFYRKVRMQRGQPWKKYYDFKKFNIFKFGLFTYFYIGHKYVKYLLYILHPALFVINLFLLNTSLVYVIAFVLQSLFYLFAFLGFLLRNKWKLKIFYYPYHYALTIIAQFYSVILTILRKSKPTWTTSVSTRKK